MTTVSYRTTLAAKILKISPHHLRRLAEAGLIEAEVTNGGHFRFPLEEIERLERNGIPDIPQAVPEDDGDHSGRTIESHSEYAQPSPAEESPEVREERDSLTIAKTQVERRKVDLERERVEDEFREREARRRKEAEEERQAQERRSEARRRREWEEQIIGYASRRAPIDCPADVRIRIARDVRAAIEALGPASDQEVVSRTADSAAYNALEALQAQRNREATIRYAVSSVSSYNLPPHMSRTLETRARRLATEAIDGVGDLPVSELQDFAKGAVEPVIAECRNYAEKKSLIRTMDYWRLMEANPDERDRATEALKAEMDGASVADTPAQLKERAKRVLAPFEDEVNERLENDREEREIAELIRQADWCLPRILRDDFEWDSSSERWQTERDLKGPLAEAIREAFEDGKLRASNLEQFVGKWVDKQLEDDDED